MRNRTAKAITAVVAGIALSLGGLGSGAASNAAAPTAAPRIPTPEKFFGFPMGTEGKLANFPDIERYLQLIAERSPKAEYEVVGKTTEDHEFPILRLSSKRNLKRLDDILATNQLLADPARMSKEAEEHGVSRDAYARKLAAKSVPVYYIEAGIHSTEVGNTQALMDIVHRLTTERSSFTKKVLNELVVLVVPSQNPDGHHKVVDYYDETAGTDYDRTYPDLYQKYTGHDNNRDWFMFTQKESRIRVRLEQKYRPAIQHWMHQAGTESPRIWSTPWDDPLDPESSTIDPTVLASSNSIGQEVNRDLISAGHKGAKTDDAYGIMWNADVMGYALFRGTTPWLTEIASTKELWSTYRSDKTLPPADATLRSPLPYDKKTWSPQQIVDYAKTGAYSGLNTAASDPDQWSYNLYQANANSETWKGGPNAYVIPRDQRDPYAAYELLRILDFGQVRIDEATKEFSAGGTTYPKGSWILRTDQPLGRWVDQLLRIDNFPDTARKCDECPLILPYSETTDNLGLLLGVNVDSVDKPIEAATRRLDGVQPPRPPFPEPPGPDGAYVVDPSSYGLGKFIGDLEHAKVPMYRATKAVEVGGTTLQSGALIVPADAPRAGEVLKKTSAATGLPVYAADTMPAVAAGSALKLKDRTRVGLIRGADNMPGGWLMWMFDQHGVDFDVVAADDYDALSEKYDTIVVASGVSKKGITEGLDPKKYPDEFDWARGVPDGPAKLRKYVEDGGNLVALGSASKLAVDALSLPAKDVTPDVDRDKTEEEKEFNVPGALLKQRYDVDVPTAWGMPKSWPTWFFNDPSYELTGDAQLAAEYPDDDDLRVSGYAKGSGKIAGASNVATFDVGQGQATIAGGQISFRSWPRVSWTMLTNAIYNGAAEPVPGKEPGS